MTETLEVRRNRTKPGTWQTFSITEPGVRQIQKKAKAAAIADGVTYEDIAWLVGCSRQTVDNFMNHRTLYCRIQTVIGILDACGFESRYRPRV
ncbi:MAG TPA: helix-turn-helix transcriptional regulator [Anaerolineae bacterium]|nr:helix-turn-helix transcriptional regulator [Anaerolineae bacterium]